MEPQKKSTFPWLYVGCGCFLLLALVAVGVVAAGYYGVRQAKGYAADLQDPEKRSLRAREMLGASQLPAGYHARVFLGVPWLFDMVVLSDGEEPGAGPKVEVQLDDLGEHAFFYMAMRDFRGQRDQYRRFLQGEEETTHVNFEVDFNFRSLEVLDRGVLEVPPQQVTYSVNRGEFESYGETSEGLFTEMLIECPDEEKLRIGFWLDRGLEDLASATGEPGREALHRFLGHFNVCAG